MIPGRALRDTISLVRRASSATGEAFGSGDWWDEGDWSPYGDPILHEATPETVRAEVHPAKASETFGGLGGNADARTIVYRVLIQPTVDLDGLARIIWRGDSYEVQSEPMMHSYRNGPHHWELNMRRIEGE